MAADSAPKLRRLTARAVRVPMREPHQAATGAVAESPRVLTDAPFDDGVVGHSVVFTYTPPTAHWLEYADWWNPILAQPLAVVGGMTNVTGTLGTGVAWNEAAVRRYSV